MNPSDAIAVAIGLLEARRSEIDQALDMLRRLSVERDADAEAAPPPVRLPALRPVPIVTEAPPKPAGRAAAKRSPGRPPGELRARLVELVDGLGRWSSTSDIAAALEAPAKRVSTILVQLHGAGKLARRPGPPAPGDQPRFEYGALALIGGRAAAGMRATDNGRVQP